MFNQAKKQQEGDYPEIQVNTPLEYLAFNLPRKAFALVLLALGGTIGTIGLALISILFLGQGTTINFLVQGIQIVLSIMFLIISIVIYSNVIKRGDNIIAREH